MIVTTVTIEILEKALEKSCKDFIKHVPSANYFYGKDWKELFDFYVGYAIDCQRKESNDV